MPGRADARKDGRTRISSLGKLKLEDHIYKSWLIQNYSAMAVHVPETLSKADIAAATARTRVPPVVEDPPLSSIIKATYRSYQEA